MAKDYYKILGVDKTATKEEIKKAYKNLAEQYRGFEGFDFSDFMSDIGGFDFDQVFESFFGGGFGRRRRRGTSRGSDLRYDIEITLEEAAKGAAKQISIPKLMKCEKCNGRGAESEKDIVSCPDCSGSGVHRREQRTPFGIFATQTTCRKCRGQGTY